MHLDGFYSTMSSSRQKSPLLHSLKTHLSQIATVFKLFAIQRLFMQVLSLVMKFH